MATYNGRELGSTDYRDKETLEWLYWDESLSLTEIADIFDVTHPCIRKWMKKNDLPRRGNVEATKMANRVEYANFYTDSKGYERWQVRSGVGVESVKVHRLLAVSEFGIDEVKDKHVHHEGGIPWLNTPGRIEVVDEKDHLQMHGSNRSPLSKEDVVDIKNRLRDTSDRVSDIASDYPVNKQTISRIKLGKRWSHVDPRSK